MRVCILGNMNLKHMTLISLYTVFFEKNDIKYDIIYRDEYGVDESCNAENVYKFNGVVSSANCLINKVDSKLSNCKFYLYAKKILKKYNYDFVVVWREETAIMFSKFLKKNYKNKFSVNIRDIEICVGRKQKYNEKHLSIAVNNSAFNTVSSDGFIRYLPKAEYLFLHSLNEELVQNILPNQNRRKIDNQIVISNVGTFRNDNFCFSLVKTFENDERFTLKFIGKGSERMLEYVKNNKIDNVICIGEFNPNETIDFLKDCDLINCAYGNDNIAETQKIPIRLYYAMILGIPVLTMKGTWIDKIACDLKFGVSLPSNFQRINNVSDIIYQQFNELDRCEYSKNVKEYLCDAYKSHKRLETLLSRIFMCK